MRRYLRLAPKMWSSPTNRAAIDELGLRTGERALDIGAGMGAATVLAARKGAQVVAVEPMPFLRSVLRVRRLAQRARKRIEVQDGAAEHLPVTDGSIDAAWAMNVMHHFTDVDAAIGELLRVLAPGGRVLLVDEDFDDPAHPCHDEVTARRHRDQRHFDEVDPATVGHKLSAAGFTVQEAATARFDGRPAKVVRARKA